MWKTFAIESKVCRERKGVKLSHLRFFRSQSSLKAIDCLALNKIEQLSGGQIDARILRYFLSCLVGQPKKLELMTKSCFAHRQ